MAVLTSLIYARERAAWIRNHAGAFNFQRRRADLLLAAVDDATRQAAGTAYNPHVQATTEAFWLRAVQSRAAVVESAVVIGAGLLFPIGWPAGRLLYRWLVGRVEIVRASRSEIGLWSIPVTALAWIAAVLAILGAAVISPSSATTLFGVLAPSWIVAQGAGLFLTASVYGVLEGWVAIPGTTGWWPFPPPALPPAGSLAVQYDSPTAGAPPAPGIDQPPVPFRIAKKPTPPPWA